MNFFKFNRAGALLRFRVMANIAGVLSLLLWLVYLPIKLTATNDNVPTAIRLIAVVHGFMYMIYVLTAFHYSLSVRKPFFSMLGYLAAGTLPIASFVADRRARAEFAAMTGGSQLPQ
jgi:integral membrane protein